MIIKSSSSIPSLILAIHRIIAIRIVVFCKHLLIGVHLWLWMWVQIMVIVIHYLIKRIFIISLGIIFMAYQLL